MADTTFDRGRSLGGDDGFKMQHGMQVRKSFPVDVDSNTDTWLRGYVLRLLDTGFVELDGATGHSGLRGLANERRSPVDGAPEEDEVKSSGKVSLVLSEGVAQTTALTSGLVFTPNEKLYPDGAGLLTNVDAGSQPVMGKVITGTSGPAGDGESIVMWYHNGSVDS